MDMQELYETLDAEQAEKSAEEWDELVETLQKVIAKIQEAFSSISKQAEEILKNIEFTTRIKYAPCLKIGTRAAPQIKGKLWRKNRALFRPYKRNT